MAFKRSFVPAVAGDFQTMSNISAGRVSGYSVESNIAGYNPSLTRNEEETIWPNGGGRYVWPDRAGEAMELSSTSNSDVGMPVFIRGLDGSGLSVTDIVILNGQSPVPTNVTFGRINQMLNVGGTNTVGTVNLNGAGGGPLYALFLAEDQQALQCIYTVPADKEAFILPNETTLNKPTGSGDACVISLRLRAPGGVFWRAARWGLQTTATSGIIFLTADAPRLVPGIDIEVTGIASAANMDATARLPLLLVDLVI